jgi:cell division protein FtsN
MLYGLAIGLAVALAVYLHDRRAGPHTDSARPAATASLDEAAAEVGETETDADRAGTANAGGDARFDFYEQLPTYEIIVPEREQIESTAPASAPPAPGRFILQAGSFKRYDDADRRKAELALLGLEAEIQKVTIGGDVFHRVRVGPVADSGQAQAMRERLRRADIDALVMRLAD